jgi:hypothetical protein
MHSHHTIPRSRGGDDSLQIILCSSCHNLLHANAVHVMARIRNPQKNPPKRFWATPDQASRADRWLKTLVAALSLPVDNPDSVGHLVGAKLNGSDFQLFKILAKNLGCSQEKAVEYCIRYTLTSQGIKNDQQTKNELWFLPSSKSR